LLTRQKFWIVLFIVVGLCSSLTPLFAASNNTSVFLESPGEVPLGGIIGVKVKINNAVNLSAYQFNLSYDPAALQIIGTEGGQAGVTEGLIGAMQVPVTNWVFYPLATQGSIRVIGYIYNNHVSGSGYLAEVHFRVIGSLQKYSHVTLNDNGTFNNSLFDLNGQKIGSVTGWSGCSMLVTSTLVCHSTGLADSTVGIPYSVALRASGGLEPYQWRASGLPPGLTISAAGVISGTPSASLTLNNTNVFETVITCRDSSQLQIELDFPLKLIWLQGDANGDGKVDVGDLVKIERTILKIDPATAGCDANQDGEINMKDASRVIKSYVGIN
jgi:hypothetical protein